MKFEKTLNDYKTTESILRASEYLKNVIENMQDQLEKISNCEIYIEQSHKSFFSNYIEFLDIKTNDTVFKIRISDHSNNEGLQAQDEDIRINDKYWREVKKEILTVVKNNFNK